MLALQHSVRPLGQSGGSVKLQGQWQAPRD
jgi:hypothetical protein